MLAIGRLVGAVHRIKIILRLDHILDHLEIGTLGNQVNVVIPADGQEFLRSVFAWLYCNGVIPNVLLKYLVKAA